jgi:hypothetical protein
MSMNHLSRRTLLFGEGIVLQESEKNITPKVLAARLVVEVELPRAGSPHRVENQTVYLLSQCH